MKRMHFLSCVLLFATLATTEALADDQNTALRKCITYNFESGNNGAMIIKNNCNAPLNVIALGYDGSSLGQVKNLKPRESRSTGADRSNFKEAGGVLIAACQSDHVATDASGNQWGKPNENYQCALAH